MHIISKYEVSVTPTDTSATGSEEASKVLIGFWRGGG
jgi:hypothetical protein